MANLFLARVTGFAEQVVCAVGKGVATAGEAATGDAVATILGIPGEASDGMDDRLGILSKFTRPIPGKTFLIIGDSGVSSSLFSITSEVSGSFSLNKSNRSNEESNEGASEVEQRSYISASSESEFPPSDDKFSGGIKPTSCLPRENLVFSC